MEEQGIMGVAVDTFKMKPEPCRMERNLRPTHAYAHALKSRVYAFGMI